MRVIIYALCFVFTFSACTNNSNLSKLREAYELLNVDSIDKAETLIDNVSEAEMDEETNALYCLAKTRLLFLQWKEPSNDSLINTAIKYYKDINPNTYYLCESYFYKGTIISIRGDQSEAIKYLKEAERLAETLDDLDTTHKIYEQLFVAYSIIGMHEYVKKYAFSVYEQSLKAKNSNWNMIGSIYLAHVYYHEDNRDSCNYYISKCEPNIKDCDEKNLPYLLSMIATYVDDKEYAQKLIQQIISIKPTSQAYFRLGNIYCQRDMYDEAYNAYSDGLKLASNSDSIPFLSAMISILRNQGRYEEALAKYDTYTTLVEKKHAKGLQESVMEITAQYDLVSAELKYQKYIQLSIIAIVMLIIAIVVYTVFNRLRIVKMREGLLEEHVLLESYKRKINDLESHNSTSSEQIEELISKVNDLQEKHNKVFNAGVKLYEQVCNGESIVKWGRQEYNDFIEYYSVLNMPFVLDLEHNYNNLSYRLKVYMILVQMGKNEDEIATILGVSNNAVRTMKSRTKSRNTEK